MIALTSGQAASGVAFGAGMSSTYPLVKACAVEPIFQASWAYQAAKVPLSAPSPEAARNLRAMPIDVYTGQRVPPSKTAFMEYFRVSGGKIRETQHALVSRGHVPARPVMNPGNDDRTERAYVYPGPQSRQAMMPSRPPRTLRELFGLQRY